MITFKMNLIKKPEMKWMNGLDLLINMELS